MFQEEKWEKKYVGQSHKIEFFFYIKIKMFHLSKAFTSHFHYTLSKSYALSFDHTDTVIRP